MNVEKILKMKVVKHGGAVAITDRVREVTTGVDLFKRLLEQIEKERRLN